MSEKQQQQHTKNREEVDDVILESEEDDDDDDDGQFGNPLVDLLVTSDGENIADGIVGALDRVGKYIDTQNKILVKMYTVLSKLSPPSAMTA